MVVVVEAAVAAAVIFATADVVLLALGAKVIERFGTGGVRR